MNRLLTCSFLFMTIATLWGCKKESRGNYPGGVVNPVISIYDLKNLYKETPLELSESAMLGSSKISGVVTSDHSGKNLPEGLLIIQDVSRFDNRRALAVNIGADAEKYVPGDSVNITLIGGKMERVNGILQVSGVKAVAVEKLASGASVYTQIVGDVNIIAKHPDEYECALITITGAEINPAPQPGQTFAGDITINDGSGDFTLFTQSTAEFASQNLPFLASYTGIVFSYGNVYKLLPRTEQDIIILSDKPPVISPAIITGFLNNSIGSDANYEYIQLMATRDIDFAETPMSVVTSNNAGTAGAPSKSWAEGGNRTYKFNLTSGTATKGSYFYVGASTMLINGANSTDISSANWIKAKPYNDEPGDGFGNKITNLLANSGNPAGIAVFDTTEIIEETEPVDVIFFGMTSVSNVFNAGPPPAGYRIANTDYYETQNTAVPSLDPQPYFMMETNMFKFIIVNDEMFRQLGGTYNLRTGKWPVKRTLTPVVLPTDGTLSLIEGATKLQEK